MSVRGDELRASEPTLGEAPAAPERLVSADSAVSGPWSGAALAPPALASPVLRNALGLLTGFLLLALTNALAIAWMLPLPHSGIGLRLAHHAFDAAETLGLGAVTALLVGLFLRFIALPARAALLVYAVAATPILYAAIGTDLHRQASVAFQGRIEGPLFSLFLCLCALGLATALSLGALFSRSLWLSWIPVAIAVTVMVGNHCVLRDDYFGVHGVIAWAAATLSGAALGPRAERAVRALRARRGGRIALALGAVTAALGVLLPPSNRVRCELFRDPCSLAWILAATVWRAPVPEGPTLAASVAGASWFTDRSSLPPIRPTQPALLPLSPIVVVITIDALRADVIGDPQNDALFPALHRIKRAGAFFTRATSPGSQTAVALTTTFSGRYFSELYWSMHGVGVSRFVYAAEDPAPRFPELLANKGVRTATFCSINFLAGEFGVTRGFQEEQVIAEGRHHALARQVIDPLLERLRRAGSGPLFLYAHLTEPHAPYDRGSRKGTDRERYLAEVAVADAQIGRVSSFLKQRFANRAILVISSDHGEAFGEHGTFQHTKTLYEEVLRVPLMVEGAGIVARTIDDHVGLIDLGPTILDLFGVDTPGTYLGQSLVPLLRGGSVALTRPLLSEGRLRRALYFGDSIKVIDDPRRKVVEVYDLARDPGETENLFDEDPARAAPALAALRAFFAAHALVREGYRAPYKP
jgi:arylsulfatase A-like enzyme